MFLTDAEIQELTGYRLPSAQKRWLTKYGWKFEISAFGRPKVLRSYAEQRMGLTSVSTPTESQPDFSHWKTS